MTRCAYTLAVMALLYVSSRAEETASETDHWEKTYQQQLKEHPEIRRKVESGGATKEEVIAWMKKGGDHQRKKSRYYGWNVDVKDPTGFQQTQAKLVYSGPQPGEKLPALRVIGLRGPHKGKDYDPVAAAKGKPLVLIFQDNSVVGQKGLFLCGEPFARIAEKAPHVFHVSTTFLVDDPTPSDIFKYDFMHEIADVIEMSISTDCRDGPGAYGLNRNVAMTVIVARDGKVLHNFAFTQPMLYPDPHIFGAVAEAIGVEGKTVVSWLADDAGEYETNTKAGVKGR